MLLRWLQKSRKIWSSYWWCFICSYIFASWLLLYHFCQLLVIQSDNENHVLKLQYIVIDSATWLIAHFYFKITQFVENGDTNSYHSFCAGVFFSYVYFCVWIFKYILYTDIFVQNVKFVKDYHYPAAILVRLIYCKHIIPFCLKMYH